VLRVTCVACIAHLQSPTQEECTAILDDSQSTVLALAAGTLPQLALQQVHQALIMQ
jgi:hypothetical protein